MFEGNTYINCQGSTINLNGGAGISIFADDYYNATLDIEYCTIYDGETLVLIILDLAQVMYLTVIKIFPMKMDSNLMDYS